MGDRVKTLEETKAAFRDRLAGLLLRAFAFADQQVRQAQATGGPAKWHPEQMGAAMTQALRDAYGVIDEIHAFVITEPVKPTAGGKK